MKRLKRIYINILMLTVINAAALLFCSAAEANLKQEIQTEIKIENKTAEYSPEGYMPLAEINVPELQNDIKYIAIDKSTSAPVELPIKNAGSYQVKAYYEGSETYAYCEAFADIVIEPVQVFILLERDIVAYTGKANEPKWTLEPSWAAEYIDVQIFYEKMTALENAETEQVSVPQEKGLYYVTMHPITNDKNFFCSSKIFVYNITSWTGRRLTSEEAKEVIPANFRCNLEEKTVEYNGNRISMDYTSFPARQSYTLSYSDGKGGFTPIAPSEPGEYEVRAGIFGKIVAKSKLTITKIKPEMKVEDIKYSYSPLGIVPKVECINPVGLEYILKAYNADTKKQVQTPIKDAGKYLIVASPADAEHYETIYATGYIEITPAESGIFAKNQVFIYDGMPKKPDYTVFPEWAETNILYYEINSAGEVVKMLGEKAPVKEGIYHAVISIAGNEKIEEASASLTFLIEPAEVQPAESSPTVSFLDGVSLPFVIMMIAFPLLLIAAVLIILVKRQKN